MIDCVSGPGDGFGDSERAAFFDGIALLRSLKVLSLVKGEAYVGGDAAVARVLRGMPYLEKVHVGDLTSEKPFADLAKLNGKANTPTVGAAASTFQLGAPMFQFGAAPAAGNLSQGV